jgi:hypothetical protein
MPNTIHDCLPYIQTDESGYTFRFLGEDYKGPHYARHNATISFAKTHALRVVYHYLKDMWGIPIIKSNVNTGTYWFRIGDKRYEGKADQAFRAWTAGLYHLLRVYEFTPDQLRQIREMFK